MRIGVDASRVAVEQPTGTERYARQVIEHMLLLDPRQRFTLYFSRVPAPGVLTRTPNAEWRILTARRLWTHWRLSLEMLRQPPAVLFVPAHVVPLAHPRATVVTVHDLGYRHFPEAHGARRRLELELTTRLSCAAARRIVVPSEATRRDLEREYGVAPRRVRVVYHGVDEDLAPVRDPSVLAAVRARYGIATDYVLSVGTLQPRKNVGRLAEAFARCRARAAHPLTLVLAGQAGWGRTAIDDQVAELEALGAVVRPGYVSRADLAALMSGASVFALPSLYEGFGMPVLEAMACGTPVLASDTSSLPEVVGDAGLLVNPLDVEAIAAALGRLLNDAQLRETLSARGLQRARGFTWTRCARETLSVLRETAVL